MDFAKILKFGKKGAKKATPKDKKKADIGFDWPSGIRIGVFGHSNSGKTVYFTVLNEDCKVARDLQISVTDNVTAVELLSNFKKIWGVGTHSGPGTHVDLQEERKFPDLTQRDRILQFTGIIDKDSKTPVVSYDYPGNAVDISEPDDYTDKVADFMDGCDGLLFFFDPKVLGSEIKCQAHIASFVSMLERLAPLEERLPIPVALVVTKADTLNGFAGDEQVVLIGSGEEPVLCEDYGVFLEEVLTNERITRDAAWAGTVREVLVKTKDFIKVAVGRTLDFQIFFISQTGEPPEKIGEEEGRSLYKPPEKVRPVGVRKPMYWLLKAIARNRSLGKLRTFTKWVRLLSICWILLVSLVYMYHFWFQLGRTTGFENNILNGRIASECSEGDLKSIANKYGHYYGRWLVKRVFPEFRTKAKDLSEKYKYFEVGSRNSTLNKTIKEFTNIVTNKDLWPDKNPTGDDVILSPRNKKLETGMKSFQIPEDSTSVLAKRVERALKLWDLLKACIPNMADTGKWNELHRTIKLYTNTPGNEINTAESELFTALLNQKAKEEKKEESKEATIDFQAKVEQINSNNNPKYRLDTAVRDLKRIRKQLNPDSDEYKKITKYISEANWWKHERTYKFVIRNLPQGAHLHVEITTEGESPKWSNYDQWFAGQKHSITWKPGDNINIALSLEDNMECNWGANASDYVIIDKKYSIFYMEGQIEFTNIGKNAKISFSPGLNGNLPTLEE